MVECSTSTPYNMCVLLFDLFLKNFNYYSCCQTFDHTVLHCFISDHDNVGKQQHGDTIPVAIYPLLNVNGNVVVLFLYGNSCYFGFGCGCCIGYFGENTNAFLVWLFWTLNIHH